MQGEQMCGGKKSTFSLLVDFRSSMSAHMSNDVEQILVVRRDFFDAIGSFQGLCKRVDD